MVKKHSRAPSKERKQQDINDPIEEISFREIHVDSTLRNAFTRDEPLGREEYENTYVLPPSGAVAYRMTPSYEEYLKLYHKFSEMRGKRKSDSDFYIANLS